MPEWLLVLIGQVFVAGAVYGGIRGDLKAAHQCANEAKATAAEAHRRIDTVLLKG